jgi:hypothetical protein
MYFFGLTAQACIGVLVKLFQQNLWNWLPGSQGVSPKLTKLTRKANNIHPLRMKLSLFPHFTALCEVLYKALMWALWDRY